VVRSTGDGVEFRNGATLEIATNWWGCNFYDQPSLDDDSGNGTGLDDCKAKFLIVWTRIRAALTDADIAKAYVMRRR